MIVSTRESQKCRERVLHLGISQISGGSRTSVGGYTEEERPEDTVQFDISDRRSLDEVVCWLMEMGYIPSFCTACYREGRTGDRFMSLCKSGQIQNCCLPNALMTLEEYLQDFPGCVIVISHDRYFTDKVVDHLLVFHGEGDIQDFPGNYTQYRDYQKLKSKEEDDRRQEEKKPKRERADYRNETRRKMTYKEKMEFERLEKEMGELEKEREQLEAALCSGTLSIDELTEKSKRLPEVKELIDEKEMRWLELSEIGG